LLLTFAGHSLAIEEDKVAGIVYNETSGLRPIKGSEDQLRNGREKIAAAAYKRNGQGMAAPHTPSGEDLKFPPAKAAWEASQSAAKSAKGKDAGTCDHVFIWPSGDGGKTPDKTIKPASIAEWPFSETAKIKFAYGPINCPKKVGDVPESNKVYIFVYSGVR
jgi:hypothetical protein